MQVTVHPSTVAGTLKSTPSKSHAQRAIAIAALTKGTSTLSGVGSSEDVLAALRIARAMGANIIREENTISIHGGHHWIEHNWDCGESGLAMRMFAAIAGLGATEITLNAHGSLQNRPVAFIEESLRNAGLSVTSQHGRPPLTVKGPYRLDSIKTDASISSQFLTGLLIALPCMPKQTTIDVVALVSIPYIDLTLETIASFGAQVTHNNYTNFYWTGDPYVSSDVTTPGDWSGMAFMLASAALSGTITISGLQYPSSQGDSQILSILTSCGVPVETNGDVVSVKMSPEIRAFDFDATHCPDLIPVLVVLATGASGISTIRGARRLRTKESDRADALRTEFRKLGVGIEVEGDIISVSSGVVKGGEVDAHGDHRIAMALACVATRATGPVHISGADSVRKSYPGFFDDLIAIGVRVDMK